MIISTPSYIIPGSYLENVMHISQMNEIQSVELLFFLFDDETEELIKKELPAIRQYSGRLGFTLHLPDELKPEHRKLIEMTKDLALQYIVHPPAEDSDRFLSVASSWIDEYGPVFLLENLIEREFESLLLAEPRFGVCMDTGHLLVRGEDPASFANCYAGRIREIHLHGLIEGWDHNGFGSNDSWFQDLLPFLHTFSGICNIELFAETQVLKVLANLRSVSLI